MRILGGTTRRPGKIVSMLLIGCMMHVILLKLRLSSEARTLIQRQVAWCARLQRLVRYEARAFLYVSFTHLSSLRAFASSPPQAKTPPLRSRPCETRSPLSAALAIDERSTPPFPDTRSAARRCSTPCAALLLGSLGRGEQMDEETLPTAAQIGGIVSILLLHLSRAETRSFSSARQRIWLLELEETMGKALRRHVAILCTHRPRAHTQCSVHVYALPSALHVCTLLTVTVACVSRCDCVLQARIFGCPSSRPRVQSSTSSARCGSRMR